MDINDSGVNVESNKFSDREAGSRKISFTLRGCGDDEAVTYSGYQSTNRRMRWTRTYSLTHSLTHSLAYSYCSDNNVKIDQSVIDKYSNDSKNDAGGSTTASNNKNSLLANMLLGGDES